MRSGRSSSEEEAELKLTENCGRQRHGTNVSGENMTDEMDQL